MDTEQCTGQEKLYKEPMMCYCGRNRYFNGPVLHPVTDREREDSVYMWPVEWTLPEASFCFLLLLIPNQIACRIRSVTTLFTRYTFTHTCTLLYVGLRMARALV